jgi:hypothetical protein
MAFGDLLGTGENQSTSPGTGLTTSSFTVAVGDLVVVAYGVRVFKAVTFSDALGGGHTWSALDSTNTGINRHLAKAYTIVTTAGSMTVSGAHASGADDAAIIACRFEGPFDASPLDANPTNVTDSTTPFDCPTTGTLAQADELVLGFVHNGNGLVYTSTSPSTIAEQAASGTGANTASVGMNYRVVAATTAVAPQFTAASSTAGTVGTASFKKGSSAKTLTIDSGSYAVTGQDVALAHGWVVAVDGSSYAISGQDVTLAKGHAVVVDAGSYAVSGQDVSLTKTWLLDVDAGSYSVTGQDVALQKGLTLNVDSGSYTVTGQDVTLAHDWAIPVDAGSYSVTGQDVTLTKTWLLDVDASSYAITGQDVALSVGFAVAVDAGSYSVTGQDVTLTKTGNLSVAVDSGSYAVTGQDVALAHQWLLDVDSGGYLLSGQDVELTLGGAAVATAGGYSDPGFWTEEHRKIKEREEGVPEPIEALSNLPEFIVPKTWGDSDEEDELSELMELMEIMDADLRL